MGLFTWSWWHERRRFRLSSTGTIYALCDPGTVRIRYIGQTKNLRQRISAHLSSARRGKRLAVCQWIRELNEQPSVLVLQECHSSLDAAEMEWIALFDGEIHLLNYTAGGDGFRGPHSEETRRKMAASRKGQPKSPEWVEKYSAAQRGQKRRPLTPAECERISKMHKGRKRSPETRERLKQASLARWQKPGAREEWSERLTHWSENFICAHCGSTFRLPGKRMGLHKRAGTSPKYCSHPCYLEARSVSRES